MSHASIGDVLENPWPRSLAVKLKKGTHVGCWRWGMFPLKDRNSGEQWLVQRGSVTLHANDRSAAGSAGSPPHRYTLVCSRSKADPTHWDRPTLTDWQGKHAPPLSCCTLSDWLVRGGATLTVAAAVTPTDDCISMNPHIPEKPKNHLQKFSFNKF